MTTKNICIIYHPTMNPVQTDNMYTWKEINDQAPKCIYQLLHRNSQLKHNLRSSNKILSEQTSRNKIKFRNKTFSFPAPNSGTSYHTVRGTQLL